MVQSRHTHLHVLASELLAATVVVPALTCHAMARLRVAVVKKLIGGVLAAGAGEEMRHHDALDSGLVC